MAQQLAQDGAKQGAEAAPAGRWSGLSLAQLQAKRNELDNEVEELHKQMDELTVLIREEQRRKDRERMAAGQGEIPDMAGVPSQGMGAQMMMPPYYDWSAENAAFAAQFGFGFGFAPGMPDMPPSLDVNAVNGDAMGGDGLPKGRSKRRNRPKAHKPGVASGPKTGKAKRPDDQWGEWKFVETDDEEDQKLDTVIKAMENKGSTEEDQRLVDEFIADLRGTGTNPDTMIQCCFGSKKGSRLVQTIIEQSEQDVQVDLAKQLSKCVEAAWASLHANFVLSFIIEKCTSDVAQYIAEGIPNEKAVQCARHEFGCRVIIKLIQEHVNMEKTQQIIGEILSQAENLKNLVKHEFGHHVVTAILDNGTEQQKRAIADQLMKDLPEYAKKRHATPVVEKALEQLPGIDWYRVALMLAEHAMGLAGHQFGYYCIKKVLDEGDASFAELEQQAGEEARRQIFDKADVTSVCRGATYEWSPSRIIAALLTTEEAMQELESQSEKPWDKGVKMVEALRQRAPHGEPSS